MPKAVNVPPYRPKYRCFRVSISPEYTCYFRPLISLDGRPLTNAGHTPGQSDIEMILPEVATILRLAIVTPHNSFSMITGHATRYAVIYTAICHTQVIATPPQIRCITLGQPPATSFIARYADCTAGCHNISFFIEYFRHYDFVISPDQPAGQPYFRHARMDTKQDNNLNTAALPAAPTYLYRSMN